MKKKLIFGSVALVLLAAIITLIIFIFNRPSQDKTDPNGDSSVVDGTGNGTDNIPSPPHSTVDLDGYVLLAQLFQHDPSAAAQSPKLPDRSYFRPSNSEFGDLSGLRAWDNNVQVLIGATDSSTGSPILLDSGSLTSNNWLSAQTSTIFNASGFELTFSTAGYENIRFTAHQKVSGDFGDGLAQQIPFELAFSTSGGVRWTAIHDSGVNVQRNDSNTFDAISAQAMRTYDSFQIPGIIDNEDEVLLRIYLNSASDYPGSGSMSVNCIKITGDVIDGGAKDIVLMELTEDDDNASALFSATPEDAFYGATDGLPDSDFRLTGWDRSRPRFIGYTGAQQTPVVFENVMTTGNWTAAHDDIANATAFQIQLRTLGYEHILFSAGQISSVNGPDEFKLAYSPDGENWIPIDNSSRIIPQSYEITGDVLPLSFNKFPLPDEFSGKESVFLRVYFDGTGDGESTSINNIEFWGQELVSYAGFSAEMLNLQPGKTSTERNITWHDWKMIGTEGKVRYEPASTAANGFSTAAKTSNAKGTDAYIRRTAHMATIENLEPDTEYVYAVSSDGENFSEMYSFKTSPSDSFTFIAISDVHMGDPSISPEDDDSGNSGRLDERYRPGVTARQGWQDSLDAITATVSDIGLIAIMGDVVDRNLIDLDSETELQPHQIKWENYLAPKQMSSFAFAPVMGNHEARSNICFQIHFNLPNEVVPPDDKMLPMASTGQQQENENRANYWYLYNNALFVALNTSTRPRDANENATQDAIIQGLIAHFDEVLASAKAAHEGEYDWLFVQTHKSISGLAKHSADFDVERYVKFGFEELMIKHEVDVVLTAHEHCYTRSFPMQSAPGPDDFGPEVPRSDFRMNNVSYDFNHTANTATKGSGTIFFTMNTISGQKFYSPYAPEFFNNVNYPYLYDGSRGASQMSLPPGENTFLSAGIETFGPKLPWNVAFYHQEYKPIFMEIKVTENSVDISSYEFAHDINGTLLDVTVIDNFTIIKP
ncbi:MAG: metallophosphoesterase family protein [Oscillospiraceae bacterium]|nr:metallophosphoesterase family protein [Oscillospiraceae bacterium]